MTLYDTPIGILSMDPDTGTPLQKLQQEFSAYCGEMEVFASRYYEAKQAGATIDLMVEIPLHRKVTGGMFAEVKGQIYAIEQAQMSHDEYRLPVTRLSLRRTNTRYEIARP